MINIVLWKTNVTIDDFEISMVLNTIINTIIIFIFINRFLTLFYKTTHTLPFM